MKTIITIIALFILASCSSTNTNIKMLHYQAPIIIYKTNRDFFNNVPITLNNAKDRIISYPAPSDLSFEGELAYPLKLKKGFLLDRRGIGRNTVFTKYTYEEYSILKSAPSLDELFESIIEKEPFEVIYNCGKNNNQKDLIIELNKRISKGLYECEQLN